MEHVESISILDCTLRDGGHLTNGFFGKTTIKKTLEKLVNANVDFIEAGFLTEESYNEDVARFKNIAAAKKVLPLNHRKSKFCLMADYINLEDIEPCDGTIDVIRLSFKRQRLDWALSSARTLKKKGYDVFINPVNCNVYSDDEYISLIKKVNDLHPYGFSIVDTFGVLRERDLSRIYYLVENNLAPDICIGVHLHENLGISALLARHFIAIHNPRRKINIDCSILGMGRAPGNLCTEQIMDYINELYEDTYDIEPVLDAINDYIEPLKAKYRWGYSVPYYLSAKYGLHRTYGEYLMNKWSLGAKDIERILAMVERKEREYFNESYIEKLYQEYRNVKVSDKEALSLLKSSLQGKHLLLVGPGKKLNDYKEKVLSLIKEKNPVTICVGFLPKFIEPNFIWCASNKRFFQIPWDEVHCNVILTSNLIHEANGNEYVLDFNTLRYHQGTQCDNSLLLILNFLRKMDVESVFLAGFDGFDKNAANYVDDALENQQEQLYEQNSIVREILQRSYSSEHITFITPSKFDFH